MLWVNYKHMFVSSEIGKYFLEVYMHFISNLSMQWMPSFQTWGNREVSCEIKLIKLSTVFEKSGFYCKKLEEMCRT